MGGRPSRVSPGASAPPPGTCGPASAVRSGAEAASPAGPGPCCRGRALAPGAARGHSLVAVWSARSVGAGPPPACAATPDLVWSHEPVLTSNGPRLSPPALFALTIFCFSPFALCFTNSSSPCGAAAGSGLALFRPRAGWRGVPAFSAPRGCSAEVRSGPGRGDRAFAFADTDIWGALFSKGREASGVGALPPPLRVPGEPTSEPPPSSSDSDSEEELDEDEDEDGDEPPAAPRPFRRASASEPCSLSADGTF